MRNNRSSYLSNPTLHSLLNDMGNNYLGAMHSVFNPPRCDRDITLDRTHHCHGLLSGTVPVVDNDLEYSNVTQLRHSNFLSRASTHPWR
jgi:hypothetical protein